VFDLDGVLIDSEELWDEVRRDLAAEAGRPWPAEATLAMQGMSTAEWSRYLCDTVGVPGPPEVVATVVIDRMAARYERNLPLLPGAAGPDGVVARFSAHWPLGLASSSPRRLIDVVLAAAGLDGDFAVTVSTEEVAAGKPAPDVYLTAAHRLGVRPAEALAVEDSTNGLRAAAAAGCMVVAVPRPAFPPAQDALELAAATVKHLDDLTTDLVAGLRPVG
jgi:beta-phosphoglucomutase-like phosphatase (HAD superfamily)